MCVKSFDPYYRARNRGKQKDEFEFIKNYFTCSAAFGSRFKIKLAALLFFFIKANANGV